MTDILRDYDKSAIWLRRRGVDCDCPGDTHVPVLCRCNRGLCTVIIDEHGRICAQKEGHTGPHTKPTNYWSEVIK